MVMLEENILFIKDLFLVGKMSQRGVLNSIDDSQEIPSEDGVPVVNNPVNSGPSNKMIDSMKHHTDRSYPYELPQLPIEQIEKKLEVQKQMSRAEKGEQKSENVEDGQEMQYQKISITGEDQSGVPPEDLLRAAQHLIEALQLRENYMKLSKQSFAVTPSRFLKNFRGESEDYMVDTRKKTNSFFCTECNQRVFNR